MNTSHAASAVHSLLPAGRDLIRVGSRRWFLQTGLAGFAGLTLADTLRAKSPTASASKKSVILFWLSGGPSQIDTWDPKPDAPAEIRGPYKTVQTSVPGIRFCEHLPLQAKLAHKLTVIRSVDCSASNHTPITMQAGHPLAQRTNDGKDGGGYPSMGSVAAKFRGSNAPAMPAFVGLADSWKADVYGAGHMGHSFEPVKGNELPGRLAMPAGVEVSHLQDRSALRKQFDKLQRDRDTGHQMAATDEFAEKALDMVISPKVRTAFDLSREPDKLRDAYGRISVGEKALLARRLVEAGSTFVLVSGRWGYFDHHGDKVPPWGGIQKGLTPILPTIDRALTTLIEDLDARGLLESTLVLMLGEFGRSPKMTEDAGRNHWTPVMSMLAAGGAGSHGCVVGSTDSHGGTIKSRKVRPEDLAATVFRHLDIPLDSQWVNPQGRPVPVVAGSGSPIAELV
jgi:hypothetical protein